MRLKIVITVQQLFSSTYTFLSSDFIIQFKNLNTNHFLWLLNNLPINIIIKHIFHVFIHDLKYLKKNSLNTIIQQQKI